MKKSEENKIVPSCTYCIYIEHKSDCKSRAAKRGKTACFRFKYDPLLRVPKPQLIIPEHSHDEFKL